ncbi:hypothetical protein Nepgr_009716 [Nepenthes gracilis]|uniref:Glutaredoxin domain-containing protein n=1 Tax=Nepenthes gracilis TaxID=150966 RepID=A0AAD3XKP2_NEPGR|nr:hypothetical protein Nepgr_009716 [Nepenthes gracilis]
MKGVKGKIVKRLKSIKAIDSMKPDRFLQVTALDGFIENFPLKYRPKPQNGSTLKGQDSRKIDSRCLVTQEAEIIDVSEIVKGHEDDEFNFEDDMDDKENISPSTSKVPVASDSNISENSGPSERKSGQIESRDWFSESKEGDSPKQMPLTEIDISSFRLPDMDSCTLFDPNLIAAFQQAVEDYIRAHETQLKLRSSNQVFQVKEESQLGSPKFEVFPNPLSDFEQRCPPGGMESVILYTTSLRGIRKTFEDCHRIRFLLESFRLIFHERDISIHLEYREELWKTMNEKLVPPRLFIKGRYIGGPEEVLGLHEQGRLRPLFEGIPIDRSNGPCEGCHGVRFIVCFNCNGSRKVFDDDERQSRCSECNENGLKICPLCC